MQRTLVVLVAAIVTLSASACGGAEESEDTVATTAPEAATTAPEASEPPPVDEPTASDEVEVVECAELEGAVNLAVQSVGCTVDGAPAPVSALPCEDGRTVLIAGDRYGIEGETWQPYDLGTGPPATELC